MTDVDSKEVSVGRATELEAQATAWVRQQHFGDWSADDQRALDEWLSLSIGHQVAYWRIDAGFDTTKRLAALHSPMRRQEVTSDRPRRWPFTLRMAAGFATICLVCVAAGTALSPKQKSYATPVGGQEIVHLADGSQIELNTNTHLRAETNFFGKRTVWLDRGEAFFDIKHDDDHPFVVFASGHRLTDLGTKFSVRASSARVRIALVEGAIRLESVDAARPQRATLVSGDVAIADAHSVSVQRKPDLELKREVSWRRGLLIFQRTTLKDAIEEFNRYNTKQLQVRGRDVGELQIGGTFNANDPMLFAHASSAMLGLRFSNHGNELVLER